MTVSELIEMLQNYPGDTRVVFHGYEGGYCDVNNIEFVPIELNVNTESYFGPHGNCLPGEHDELALLIE